MQYIMSLDQGTTSSRAIVFAADGSISAMAQQSFAQHYPRPGWVEHDPMEIWSSEYSVMKEVIADSGAKAAEIARQKAEEEYRKAMEAINSIIIAKKMV